MQRRDTSAPDDNYITWTKHEVPDQKAAPGPCSSGRRHRDLYLLATEVKPMNARGGGADEDSVGRQESEPLFDSHSPNVAPERATRELCL
jgi:hypothetical protein